MALLNYCGSIWMNQAANLDTTRVEYHKAIRMLSPRIQKLSICAMMNFNDFPHFDTIIEKLNAKSASQIQIIQQQSV